MSKRRFGHTGEIRLVYSPDEPDNARPLPDVITSEMLVDAFEEAAGDS